ncbi:MAG: helix-turn-helix domain-containing protein [Blastocatellia bacterium]
MTPKKPDTLLDTNEAAERLGVTRRQITTLIQQGKLRATKMGRDWFIDEDDLESVKERPRRGRPRKEKSEDDEEK